MKRSPAAVISAGAFTASILALGHIAFGFWTMLIFSSGFLTGYILWLCFTNQPAYATIRTPYWLAFAGFALHRVEEKLLGFFAGLAAITGVPTPEATSWPVLVLVATSIRGWLIIPLLTKRGNPLGYYLAWTFFSAMGIIELGHYVFPFFLPGRYVYFPGMISVVVLAPLGWWGMSQLIGETGVNVPVRETS